MPLALMKVGDKARIMAVKGSDAAKKHLGSLGLVPGVMVTVVQVMSGSMIVGIRDSRLAINEDLLRRVMVQPA